MSMSMTSSRCTGLKSAEYNHGKTATGLNLAAVDTGDII
jgi:hypothetical protein